MPKEPKIKRTIAFFDGQNLYYAAKKAFGYDFPNYDPVALAKTICDSRGWILEETRFYTGVPSIEDLPFWHDFWANKIRSMTRNGVIVYSRPLRYKVNPESPGAVSREEKGIDVRIALDVIRKTFNGDLDVALIFSQDQDLSEVADEVRAFSVRQKRWIKVASAFPFSPAYSNRRGINNTEWVQIDADTYKSCIDPWDYRQPDDNS